MPYCTPDDMEFAAGGPDRLTDFSDFERTGERDDDNIDLAIAEADGWINTFIQIRFGIASVGELNDEIAPTDPSHVRAISRNEAVYILKKNRGLATPEDDTAHLERETRLQRFANGEITLGFATQPAASDLVVDEYIPRTRPNRPPSIRKKFEGFR